MIHNLSIVLNTILSLFGLGALIWFFVHGLKNSADPAKIIFKFLFSAALIVGEVCLIRWLSGSLHAGEPEGNAGQAFVIAASIGACGIILSIIWTPHISEFLFKPLTDVIDGGNKPPDPKPYYSIAQTKRKLNHPLEAIVEVRKQLDKFPNDYEGVSLLASIQAEDTKDLPSAEITLRHFCNSEKAPPKQIAAALTQLADWHLKLAQDADSARAVLEEISARFPDSELSLLAKERIAHLGGAKKILLAAYDRQAVVVPEGVKNAGLRDSMKDLVPSETKPEELAAFYVKHLEEHPQDTEAREKLAVLYASHYQRLDLATMELSQLINEPNHPPKRVAHWLHLLADLQIHGGADYDTVRATLEKIVESFPDLPLAHLARSRLGHLKLELKGQQQATDKKLGVYEQNVGLKHGPAYGSLGRKL